jgi:hypothetical protein
MRVLRCRRAVFPREKALPARAGCRPPRQRLAALSLTSRCGRLGPLCGAKRTAPVRKRASPPTTSGLPPPLLMRSRSLFRKNSHSSDPRGRLPGEDDNDVLWGLGCALAVGPRLRRCHLPAAPLLKRSCNSSSMTRDCTLTIRHSIQSRTGGPCQVLTGVPHA